MKMKEEIVAYSKNRLPTSILDLPPSQMADQIAQMANVLSDIIEKQTMFQMFGKKKYVKVDGWCTLGTMLGILPSESEVKEYKNGWYAKVDLVNKNSGITVGSASAICTRDETGRKDSPEYAIRSMAITRATGKAYRLAFSWIMNMAGYESTPAEEMIDETHKKPGSLSRPISNVAQEKLIFDAKNSAHIDKLEKVLLERDIPPQFHLPISDAFHGKEFSKESLQTVIESFDFGQ